MKVYLDDERSPPDGWMLVRWPEDVIRLMKFENVEVISLDHDLGDDPRTGYDVLLWIEREVVINGFVPPEIRVHTANPAARLRMLAAVESIQRLAG